MAGEKAISPFVQEFEKRLELGRRAQAIGILAKHCEPSRFMTWLEMVKLSYPAEMDIMLPRISNVDWEARFDDLTRVFNETCDELDALQAREAELSEKPGWSRERDSLLKLVIGMAIKGYGYSPAAQRNPAVSDISGDLRQLGVPLDEDTIRKYLKEGKSLIPEI